MGSKKYKLVRLSWQNTTIPVVAVKGALKSVFVKVSFFGEFTLDLEVVFQSSH